MQRWDKPMLRLPNGKIKKFLNHYALFFEQLREYHPAIKWLVRPVSKTNISNFICGAKSVKNVFERYGRLDDQGHAWWFGRKSIRDNEFYDHRTAEQLTEKARCMMLSEEIVGSIANVARQLKPLDATEFLKTHVNAVHHTPYGLCTHDFAQNPCEKHLNCLSNCKEYHRIIGNQEERNNLIRLQNQTNSAL